MVVRKNNVLCLLLCATGLLSAFPERARSQQNVPPEKDLTQRTVTLSLKAESFADVIATLSTKLGINILADDEPLRRELSLEFTGNAREALDRICDAFDYTWREKPGGIVVLYKRFQNVAEHPQYNLLELRRMAHAVSDIYQALSIDPSTNDFSPRMNAFWDTLTPDQQTGLKNGGMLHGSDLFAEQSRALQAVMLQNMFAGQVMPWQNLAAQLDGFDRTFFQVREWPNFYLRALGVPPDSLQPRGHLEMVYALKPPNEPEIRVVMTEAVPRPNPAGKEDKKP